MFSSDSRDLLPNSHGSFQDAVSCKYRTQASRLLEAFLVQFLDIWQCTVLPRALSKPAVKKAKKYFYVFLFINFITGVMSLDLGLILLVRSNTGPTHTQGKGITQRCEPLEVRRITGVSVGSVRRGLKVQQATVCPPICAGC